MNSHLSFTTAVVQTHCKNHEFLLQKTSFLLLLNFNGLLISHNLRSCTRKIDINLASKMYRLIRFLNTWHSVVFAKS